MEQGVASGHPLPWWLYNEAKKIDKQANFFLDFEIIPNLKGLVLVNLKGIYSFLLFAVFIKTGKLYTSLICHAAKFLCPTILIYYYWYSKA